MDINAIETVFWRALRLALPDFPESDIRIAYALASTPSISAEDDVIYLSVTDMTDSYIIQYDETYDYDAEAETVMLNKARTAVLQVKFTCYGPEASKNINAVKDGVILQEVQRFLSKENLHIIPRYEACQRVPEQVNGGWWNRWDWTSSWNYLYVLPAEDVGIITTTNINIEGA